MSWFWPDSEYRLTDEQTIAITFSVKQSYFRHFGVSTEFDLLDFFRISQVVALQQILQFLFSQNIGNFSDKDDVCSFPYWVFTWCLDVDGGSVFLGHWASLFPGIDNLDCGGCHVRLLFFVVDKNRSRYDQRCSK